MQHQRYFSRHVGSAAVRVFSACTCLWSCVQENVLFSDKTSYWIPAERLHTLHNLILLYQEEEKKTCNILWFICPVINHLSTVMIIAVPQTKDCALRFVWNESSEAERSEKEIGSNDCSDTARRTGPRGIARQTRAINRNVIVLWEPVEMDTPQPHCTFWRLHFRRLLPFFSLFIKYIYILLADRHLSAFLTRWHFAHVVRSRSSFHFAAQIVFASCFL